MADALNGRTPEQIRAECVDAAAVLRRIWMEADHTSGISFELERLGQECRAELERLFP